MKKYKVLQDVRLTIGNGSEVFLSDSQADLAKAYVEEIVETESIKVDVELDKEDKEVKVDEVKVEVKSKPNKK